jgi:hypothetical protein
MLDGLRTSKTPKASGVWRDAHSRLLENVKSQAFIPQDGEPAYAKRNGQRIKLPAYIPYIGPHYFQHKPRILCYAINQNLSRHARWTEDWTSRWGLDINTAVDRLNRAATEGLALPIKPYAEGFIPLVALLALKKYGKEEENRSPLLIDQILAVTNFVKFSTAEDASSSSIPDSWWYECAHRYVKQEIQILAPDIVVSFGQRTTVELSRILGELRSEGIGPLLLGCRFPCRIPSIKARPLTPPESRIWSESVLPLTERMLQPKVNTYHKWRMLQYPGYFLDVVQSWDVSR